MPLIKRKKSLIKDQPIVGEVRFTKFVESGGKRIHENVYIVDICLPKPSIGFISVSHSLVHKVFQTKEEAVTFFDLEFKKIVKQRKEAK
jgi:hypothetical protein